MRLTKTQRKIIEETDRFPVEQTVEKTREELLELHEALGEGFPSADSVQELADVIIMCDRLMGIIGWNQVSDAITAKLERTKKRVAEGYYDRK